MGIKSHLLKVQKCKFEVWIMPQKGEKNGRKEIVKNPRFLMKVKKDKKPSLCSEVSEKIIVYSFPSCNVS